MPSVWSCNQGGGRALQKAFVLWVFPVLFAGDFLFSPGAILLSELWLSGKTSFQWLDLFFPLDYYIWLMQAFFLIWKSTSNTPVPFCNIVLDVYLIRLGNMWINHSLITLAAVSGMTPVWSKGNNFERGKLIKQLQLLDFFLRMEKQSCETIFSSCVQTK